jgi:hypothetical protein
LVASKQGDNAAARALYEESLAIYREVGDRLRIAELLEALAALACERQSVPGAAEGAGAGVPEADATGAAGRGWRAARLFGAAAALREAIGAPVEPRHRAAYCRQVSRAREQLSEEAFAAAWAKGAAMGLDQAISSALGQATECVGA